MVYLPKNYHCHDYNENCDEYKDQVQIVKVDANLSKGPTDARSKLSALIHWDHVHAEESSQLELQPVGIHDFCMQIDSHMDFSDNFDTGLIAMHHRAQNDYAVLSTYVADIEQVGFNQKSSNGRNHLLSLTYFCFITSRSDF